MAPRMHALYTAMGSKQMSLCAVAPIAKCDAEHDFRTIDLDASANTAPTATVIEAVVDAMSARCGNPSSPHARGDRSREILRSARDAVAGLVNGAFGEDVVLTSGCTEANNLVLHSFARRRARIVTSAVEHPSILAAAARIASDGGDVIVLPVARDGTLDLAALQKALRCGTGSMLVSIQAGNSETGVVQDLARIAEMVGDRKETTFHSDAAQAIGRMTISMGHGVGPDLVTMSGHKLHAPMGVGALLVASDTDEHVEPALLGGEQERGLRAGTEAVPAIAGLAAAGREWLECQTEHVDRLNRLRLDLERRLCEIPDVAINGHGAARLPHVCSATFRGCDAMALVAQLDLHGVAASQGSACSSRKPTPSHVLTAMGIGEADAFSTIRLSLSIHNDESQVARAVEVIESVVRHIRRANP